MNIQSYGSPLGVATLLWTLASSNVYGNGATVAGTDARVEMEFKVAYEVEGEVSLDKVAEVAQRALQGVIRNKSLAFPELAGKDYYLDEAFQAFMFRDVYMDTPDLKVLASGSAYRLRHRWNRYENYLRHRLLPFMRGFDPTRCEIQFKTGYQLDHERQVVSPKETRFEFRNESSPFDMHLDAPPPPWPVEEYLQYAASGQFRNYRIKPMVDLRAVLDLPADTPVPLEPVVEVLTVRDRIHLNIQHPWGSGPNPEQVFIITLDKTTVGNTYGRTVEPVTLLEMEVEIERNTSTEIHHMMALADDEVRYEAVKQAAVRHSQAAWQALVADLNVLRDALYQEISLAIQGRALPLNYKYARIMQHMETPPPKTTQVERGVPWL